MDHDKVREIVAVLDKMEASLAEDAVTHALTVLAFLGCGESEWPMLVMLRPDLMEEMVGLSLLELRRHLPPNQFAALLDSEKLVEAIRKRNARTKEGA